MTSTGLDELTLRRVRRAFRVGLDRIPWPSRIRLLSRQHLTFAYLNIILCDTLPAHQWQTWLKYVNTSETHITTMCRNTSPIPKTILGPYEVLFAMHFPQG